MRVSDHAGFALRARAFLHHHHGRETSAMVSNLDAQVDALQRDDGCPMPVTVHHGGRDRAWVCSPRTTYGDCAAEEAARYLPRPLAPLALHGLAPLGAALSAAGLDRNVAVNNWLLSTNLYPPIGRWNATELIEQAAQRWPGHAIWFRSLNDVHNADWIEALDAAGCLRVASRQVWLYRDLDRLAIRHQNLRRDLALLSRSGLVHCGDAQIVEADYARIATLYHMLYVGKYSRFNPVYTTSFLRTWHRAGLLQFEGFRDGDGQLQTIVGMFGDARVVTSPIVGYNTALPRRAGLYRLATACVYRTAIARGLEINFSGGAASFKRLRGGQPAIEYSAVHVRHLPARTRLALRALSTATCRVGAPLLRRYGL